MAEQITPREVLEAFENRFITAFQDSLERHNRLASGVLWQSIKAETKIFGQSVVLEISMDEYWKFVNEGVNGTQNKVGSPFSFKKKNLKTGAMLKHIANRGEYLNPIAVDIANYRKDSKGLKVKRNKPLPIDKARKSLAFLLGRNISKKGIKPTHFADEVVSGELRLEFQKELSMAVGRNIKIEIQSIIDNE